MRENCKSPRQTTSMLELNMSRKIAKVLNRQLHKGLGEERCLRACSPSWTLGSADEKKHNTKISSPEKLGTLNKATIFIPTYSWLSKIAHEGSCANVPPILFKQ
jgi:hypothetical protein